MESKRIESPFFSGEISGVSSTVYPGVVVQPYRVTYDGRHVFAFPQTPVALQLSSHMVWPSLDGAARCRSDSSIHGNDELVSTFLLRDGLAAKPFPWVRQSAFKPTELSETNTISCLSWEAFFFRRSIRLRPFFDFPSLGLRFPLMHSSVG